MTTKTIDDCGRLTLGPEYAGQTVIVDDSNPDRLVVTRAKPSESSDDEEAEWAELERRALPSERLDAIAEFLRSTGQASE